MRGQQRGGEDYLLSEKYLSSSLSNTDPAPLPKPAAQPAGLSREPGGVQNRVETRRRLGSLMNHLVSNK